MSFADRIDRLPHLGIGVSTEYGAGGSPGSLDVFALRDYAPRFASFLEVGVEVIKGLDWHTRDWIERGWPTTYHFLDINLDEPGDTDAPWLAEVRAIAERLRPAWMCGDAGLWHFGRRDRGHMLLLPPILSVSNASAMADGVARLRAETGFEVFPENPPSTVYLGDLHILDYFARVCERADTGMLLDCAHLAIYQRLQGHQPTTGLDGFPLDRVIEIHLAGGRESEHQGFAYVEDSHTPAVLDDTWAIMEYVVSRSPNLKAVVFECERNRASACFPGFARIEAILQQHAVAPSFRNASADSMGRSAGQTAQPDFILRPPTDDLVNHFSRPGSDAMTHVDLQHVVVRMLYDSRFSDSVFEAPDRALAGIELSPQDITWILQTDARAFRTDPHRRARSLTGLLEEYPASSFELVRLARRHPPGSVVDDFFSWEGFHRGMQAGKSLAISFGEFLVRAAAEWHSSAGSASGSSSAAMVRSLAALELAIARLRRLRLVEAPTSTGLDASAIIKLRTAPTYAWVDVHPDTLDRFSSIRQRIALQNVDARAAIVDLAFDLGAAAETTGRFEPVLLSAVLGPAPAPGGWVRVIDVEISPISEELASVLTAAQEGIDTKTLLDRLRVLGADDSESLAILNDLVRDGLLNEVQTPDRLSCKGRHDDLTSHRPSWKDPLPGLRPDGKPNRQCEPR